MVVLYTDGGCSENDQRDVSKRRMVAVVTSVGGAVLSEHEEAGGSNNVAELIAVRDALAWCARTSVAEVEIRTDSRNNLAWAAGRIGKRLNDRPRVLALHAEVAALMGRVATTLTWVPRDANLAGHYIEERHGL